VAARARNRIGHGETCGETGGDRGRQRTSGAVRRRLADPWPVELVERGAVEEHVDRRTGEVPAGDARCPGAEVGARAPRVVHGRERRAAEARLDVHDRVHGHGVLRGERRHHARAVDREGMERLQVGLDAGRAARVRARDGERHRRHGSALYPRRPTVNAVAASTPIRYEERMDVDVYPKDAEAFAAAAALVAEALRAAAGAARRAKPRLAAGRGGRGVMVASPERIALPWDRIEWFWGDERCVPVDDPRSNVRLARESLLGPRGIAAVRIHPPPVELARPEAIADAYGRA